MLIVAHDHALNIREAIKKKKEDPNETKYGQKTKRKKIGKNHNKTPQALANRPGLRRIQQYLPPHHHPPNPLKQPDSFDLSQLSRWSYSQSISASYVPSQWRSLFAIKKNKKRKKNTKIPIEIDANPFDKLFTTNDKKKTPVD